MARMRSGNQRPLTIASAMGPAINAVRRSSRLLRRFRRRLRLIGGYPHIVSLLILFGPLLALVLAGKLARIDSQYFSIFEIADFLRSEIFFIASIMLLWGGMILAARTGLWRWVFTLIAAVLWLVICLTEVFGTGYQLTTGDDGFTYPLLVYAVKKLPQIAPMFTAEISKAIIPLLALGALIGLFGIAFGYLARRAGKRRTLKNRHNRKLGGMLVALSPAALIIAGLPGYYSNDLLASRALTVNAVLDVLDLVLNREPRTEPLRASFPTEARLVSAMKGADHPNLVIVVLESTRAQAVSVYNPGLETTPFLDQLAKTSTVAERAYAVVPQTSKSLVSILCGLESYLRRAVREARPDRGVPGKCLAGLLRDFGYQTAYFQSATKSFELRAGLVANFEYQTFLSGDEMDPAGLEEANYFGYEDGIMLGPSRQWLEQLGDRPFFTTYLTNTPHHPYLAPKRYGIHDFAENKELNRYLNSVYYVDHFVRDLIGQYKELGLYDNTVFIIMGDHGEGFGEHGRKQHITTIYDEGLRVPLLIHDGRNPQGATIEHPVSALDVLPTAIDLMGLRLEDGEYAGGPMLQRPDDAAVMSHCWRERQCMALVRGDIKLIHHFDNRPDELFDVAADPGEKHDIAADFPDIARAMRGELKAWRAGVNAYYRAYYRMMKSRG
ncbi:MAG: sulfatase-like hydrolase/transferase [Sphingomonadales bacterium]